MVLLHGNPLLELETRRRSEKGRLTLEFALNDNIVWSDVNHIAGRVVNYHAGEDNCIFTNFNFSAELAINRSFLHNSGDTAGYSVCKKFGVPRDMDVAMDITGSNDGIVLYDGISANSAGAGDRGAATGTGIIPQDGISVYICFFCCDRIVCNPALPILTQIFF